MIICIGLPYRIYRGSFGPGKERNWKEKPAGNGSQSDRNLTGGRQSLWAGPRGSHSADGAGKRTAVERRWERGQVDVVRFGDCASLAALNTCTNYNCNYASCEWRIRVRIRTHTHTHTLTPIHTHTRTHSHTHIESSLGAETRSHFPSLGLH